MARTKLSEEDKQKIRILAAEGAPRKALSLQFGVSYNTIKRIVDPQYYAEHIALASQYSKENQKKIYEQNKLTFRRYSIKFNRALDAKVIEKLDSEKNVTDYLRRLITADLEHDQ